MTHSLILRSNNLRFLCGATTNFVFALELQRVSSSRGTSSILTPLE